MDISDSTLVARREDRTLADHIERTLAVGILRGEPAVGVRLPSVRELATQFEVTVPTIQRALDRLERAGLVTARRGSGITVNDPRRNMNLSLIPLWFEALADQPERAAVILRDFLELRRILAAHLFESASPVLVSALPRVSAAAATLLASTDLRAVALADAQLTQVVVETVDNFALNAVFYTVERLALEVPHIAEALYGDRTAHRAVIAQVVRSFAMTDRAAARDELLRAFEAWDALTVRAFTERLQRATQES